MRMTQGTFSFLPDLTDEQVTRQVAWALAQGYALSVESTDDPHPRNVFWELHGPPMFDVRDPAAVLREVAACRAAHPDRYVKVNGFDSRPGWETVRLSFLVQRPPREARYRLERRDGPGRSVSYGLVREEPGARAPGGREA